MWGYRFLADMAATWRDRTWQKFDAVCPWAIYHANHYKKDRLDCVRHYHFLKYCHGPKKMRKLYWKLHPEEKG